jgi:hypothetical protein
LDAAFHERADSVPPGCLRGSALQLGEHVESVPRLGELIYTVHAVTRGSDEVVAIRPDRSVCAEIEIDVVIAVHPATLADELASRLLLLDGDFGDAFIHFAQDELVVAGLVAGHAASPPSTRTTAASKDAVG